MRRNEAGTYEEFDFDDGDNKNSESYWRNLFYLEEQFSLEKSNTAYDFLIDYSSVYNLYPASTPQPNPMSNKVLFIIDTLNKFNVKYTLDIFTYEGNAIIWGMSSSSSHKLVNIIVEPNPQATGPAIVFVAHHDVMNVHSNNVQDNGASVCNLLRLASLIKTSKDKSQRTLILFTDSEEGGTRGAKHFAIKSKKNKSGTISHDTYGEISAVINLELTGKGTEVWSDCHHGKDQDALHLSLESVLKKPILKLRTPPSDAGAFRQYNFPVLCIGILPKDDIHNQNTWRICHSINDTIEKCDGKDMENFTNFLFNITKNQILINQPINLTINHGSDNINQSDKAGGQM